MPSLFLEGMNLKSQEMNLNLEIETQNLEIDTQDPEIKSHSCLPCSLRECEQCLFFPSIICLSLLVLFSISPVPVIVGLWNILGASSGASSTLTLLPSFILTSFDANRSYFVVRYITEYCIYLLV